MPVRETVLKMPYITIAIARVIIGISFATLRWPGMAIKNQARAGLVNNQPDRKNPASENII